MKSMFMLSCLAALLMSPAQAPQAEDAARAAAIRAVEEVLADFQAAGVEADAERFFGHLAPEAIYLGTDATERHTVEELRARIEPHFAQGTGWTSRLKQANVSVTEDARLAWFDARLEREPFGELRASGVLEQRDDVWLIVQYNVSLPIPNEAVRDVVKLIRAANKKRR